MTVADILIIIGAIVLLAGELIAVFDSQRGNTITERVKWFAGIGRPITPWYLASRILVFGFCAWLLLHFAGTGV